MSEPSSDLNASPAAAPNAFNPLKLLSLLLIVPAILLCSVSQALPALDTLATSRTNSDLLRESEDIGFENYERLFDDRRLGEALEFTGQLMVVRLLIIAIVPLMVGLLVGVQPRLPRLFNRVFLASTVVVLSPIFLAALWGFILGYDVGF